MALKALTSKRSIGIGFSKYRPSSTKFSILFYLFHLISLHFILFYFIFILFVFSKYRHYVGGGPNLAFCLKIFLGQCLYSSFQHTKNAHCISHFTKQQCYVFPKNPHTLAGSAPASSVPQGDAMTTAPGLVYEILQTRLLSPGSVFRNL
jgi:hypothetical protein